MSNFTTPQHRSDILGFLLFGFRLVLISVGIELLGEQLLSAQLASVILAGGILLLLIYIKLAHHHRTPFISLPIFKTRTSSIGIAGNIVTRLGTGSVPFLMPLMLQVGSSYSALRMAALWCPQPSDLFWLTRVLRQLD